MMREALGYIQRNYLHETVLKHPDRAEATRVWNFPYVAIEEALVNAVYHRSYEEREPIEVRIGYDEVVILSFPTPDRSIRTADFEAGRSVSRRYRNRRIGEFLKELDLTEGRSAGVPIVVHELCHLRYRDHSDAFWNEVDKVLPDYRERKEWLRVRGAELEL